MLNDQFNYQLLFDQYHCPFLIYTRFLYNIVNPCFYKLSQYVSYYVTVYDSPSGCHFSTFVLILDFIHLHRFFGNECHLVWVICVCTALFAINITPLSMNPTMLCLLYLTL